MSEVALKTNSEDTKDKKGTPKESENFFSLKGTLKRKIFGLIYILYFVHIFRIHICT